MCGRLLFARINLSDFDGCRLRSCVWPFDVVDVTAGLDEVRTLGPKQASELRQIKLLEIGRATF